MGTQVGQLAKRSVVRVLRQPALVLPGLILPLFLLAVNAQGLSAATRIRGFPTHSYFTFALATAFVQAAVFSMTLGGTDLAEDIRTGFMSRLALTPMRRAALLSGQLAGEAVQGQGLLLFFLIFFSSAFLPRDLIRTDWFRSVATYNPVSYLVEGMRSLIITGWDAKALALGFGFALLILAAALSYAARLTTYALRPR